MAELRDQRTGSPDEPSRGQPNGDAARPHRDRPGQPSDAQMRRFEQGARDYVARRQGSDVPSTDQSPQPGRAVNRPHRPGGPRPSELARFESQARQYADRHRAGDNPSRPDNPGTARDRPGQPRQSDIDKVDRTIADRDTRHPQHASDRQAIWAKIREASDTFGERRDRPDHPRDHERQRQRPDQPAEREPADSDARIEDSSRHDTRSGRDAEPEITGMRLPEGFDDGDVHWLRRYRDQAPDLGPLNGADGVARKPEAPSAERRIEEAGPDAPPLDEGLPTGDQLVEPDEEDASRLDQLRAKLFEKDFLGDLESAAAEWGDIGHDSLPVHRPTGHPEVRSPHVTPSAEHQHQGVDGGDAVTAVIFGSIVASEMTRRLYHRIDDWKEARRNARDG